MISSLSIYNLIVLILLLTLIITILLYKNSLLNHKYDKLNKVIDEISRTPLQ